MIIYNNIIDRAKHRDIDGYYERHHIKPRSLGGDDSDDNIVKLTAKEHYIVHHLLWKHYKIINDVESATLMSYAFWSMCIQHKEVRYVSATSYNKIREEHTEMLSNRYKGKNNPNYGNGEKMKGDKNPMYGVRRSDDWKKKHSELLKGKEQFKKENNSASKEYYVIDTNTNIETFIKKGYLRDYCESINVKYTTLFVTLKRGTPISRGKYGLGLILREA